MKLRRNVTSLPIMVGIAITMQRCLEEGCSITFFKRGRTYRNAEVVHLPLVHYL